MEFGASDNGVAFGAFQSDAVPLSAVSLGAANAPPKIGPVVINEIMYHPGSNGTEFIELCNVAGTNIDLAGWVLRGANYSFPSVPIAPGGFLVLAGTSNISAAEFRTRYGVPGDVPVLTHNFDLQNSGELLELAKPNDSPTNAPILVDRVRYNDKALWPQAADGSGPSLEKIVPTLYGNDPVNWRAWRTGGSPGQANTTRLLNARRQSGAFTFEFATVPGNQYTIQFSPTAEPDTWQTLTNFISNGTRAEFSDTPITLPTRFYRVQMD